jgi:hypothetical protein
MSNTNFYLECTSQKICYLYLPKYLSWSHSFHRYFQVWVMCQALCYVLGFAVQEQNSHGPELWGWCHPHWFPELCYHSWMVSGGLYSDLLVAMLALHLRKRCVSLVWLNGSLLFSISLHLMGTHYVNITVILLLHSFKMFCLISGIQNKRPQSV